MKKYFLTSNVVGCIICNCYRNNSKDRASMDFNMLELQIAAAIACIVGCGWTSWKLGHQAGIVNALNYLEKTGIIEFDEGESSL